VSRFVRSIALCTIILSCAEGAGLDPEEDETSSDQDSGGAIVAAGGAGAQSSGGAEAQSSGGAGAGGTATGGRGSSTGGNHDQAGGGGTASGGGSSAAGGAPSHNSPLFPAPDSEGQCPDPSLRLRFEGTPALGDHGEVRVYDAAAPDVAVARIDLSQGQIVDSIGGTSFNLPRPAYVDGQEVVFLLPAAGLKYGHRYFVLVDEGAVLDPDGNAVIVSEADAWRFQISGAAPTDREHLSVALDGTGQFCSLQGALDAATSGTTIHLAQGAYWGVSYVQSKNRLRLVGADRDTTRILGVNNNNLNPSTRTRALFGTEHLKELIIENLTIENMTAQGGSQAEALALLSCDQCVVRNSTIISRQDTLLWSGRVYAEDSRIEGNVDYIWGTGAAYFNRVEVRTIGRSGYNVQARNTTGYGYVFVDSRLTADPGIKDDVLARIDVSAYPNSHVAYIDCEIGPHIADSGWSITGSGSRTGLRFWEYGSHTPGGEAIDVSKRADGSRQLTAEEAAQMRDPAVVLGGWDPR